jgi:gamma-aminobutyric acid receptor subunit beta
MGCARSILQSGLLALILLPGIALAPAVAAENGPGDSAALRPDPEGRATRVSVGTYVVDISEIDDSKRTFTADLYVLLHWQDPRLASQEAAPRKVPLSTVWHPDVLLLNQRSVTRLLPEVAQVDRQGNVEYHQRYQGTFSIPLDLRNFPLDEQVLAVRMVCPGQSPAELELVPDPRSGRLPAFTILDWAIESPTSQAEPLATPEGHEIAGFRYALPARRRAGAYVYQFGIPLTFIVCMSWAPFWMAPEQLGPRQAIAVSSMLTIIAYRFIVVNQLPRVAYLTRFDYLLLACTTLVFLVLVEVVAAHWVTARNHPEQAQRLDKWARGVFPALFLALVLGAVGL